MRAYPESPTAQRYLKAYKLAEKGLQILRNSNYTDKHGLTCLAHAWLTENTIKNSLLIQWNEKVRIFLFASSVLSSGDPKFFEGVLVTYALMGTAGGISKDSVMRNHANLAALSNLTYLIQKAEPCPDTKVEPGEFGDNYTSWLHELFFFMGSILNISDQFGQAAKVFGKSLELCPSNFKAKIALGYSLFNARKEKESVEQGDIGDLTYPESVGKVLPKRKGNRQDVRPSRCSDLETWEKVKQLYNDYLKNAPKCSKKYPNACYHMAFFYMARRNMPKMQEYFQMGQDAEELRLPFLGPVDIPMKHKMSSLCQLAPPMRCNNPGCTKKVKGGDLKNCPCCKVFYCDR